MGFADFYFERQKDFQVKSESTLKKDLKYIVVIPCYYEFEIISTLNSIRNTNRPKSSVEILNALYSLVAF